MPCQESGLSSFPNGPGLVKDDVADRSLGPCSQKGNPGQASHPKISTWHCRSCEQDDPRNRSPLKCSEGCDSDRVDNDSISIVQS